MTPHDPTDLERPSRFARRDLLRMGLAGGGALAATPLLGGLTGAREGVTPQAPPRGAREGVPLQASSGGVITGKAPTDPPRFPHFSQPLAIPPELRGTLRSDGRTYFQLKQYEKELQILPKPFPPTKLLTFNGMVPGPTIRQTRNGSISVVENINALPPGNPYSPPPHGPPSQPFYDGHPDDLTPVGAKKSYIYPNQQTARTL